MHKKLMSSPVTLTQEKKLGLVVVQGTNLGRIEAKELPNQLLSYSASRPGYQNHFIEKEILHANVLRSPFRFGVVVFSFFPQFK